MQLKVMQEVITLTIFTIFTLLFFKTETLKVNYIIAIFMFDNGCIFYI